MVVTDLLVKHFPKILDLKFTAHMEDELDDIATAKEDMVKVLDEFYHPFQESLEAGRSRAWSGCRSLVGDLPRLRRTDGGEVQQDAASSWAARSTPSARRPGRSTASPAPRRSRPSTAARSAASR